MAQLTLNSQPLCPFFKLPLLSRMTYTLLCGPQATPENERGHRKGSSYGAEHFIRRSETVELLAQVTTVLPEPEKTTSGIAHERGQIAHCKWYPKEMGRDRCPLPSLRNGRLGNV